MMAGSLPVLNGCCQICLPVEASWQKTENSSGPVIAVLMSLPATMIGQLTPSPSVASHRSLSVAENSTGSRLLVETPLQFGPRNCAQSSAQSGDAIINRKN